LGIITTF